MADPSPGPRPGARSSSGVQRAGDRGVVGALERAVAAVVHALVADVERGEQHDAVAVDRPLELPGRRRRSPSTSSGSSARRAGRRSPRPTSGCLARLLAMISRTRAGRGCRPLQQAGQVAVVDEIDRGWRRASRHAVTAHPRPLPSRLHAGLRVPPGERRGVAGPLAEASGRSPWMTAVSAARGTAERSSGPRRLAGVDLVERPVARRREVRHDDVGPAGQPQLAAALAGFSVASAVVLGMLPAGRPAGPGRPPCRSAPAVAGTCSSGGAGRRAARRAQRRGRVRQERPDADHVEVELGGTARMSSARSS